jgi:hypothetical protein
VPGQSLSELKECFDGRDTNGGFVIMLGRKTVVWLRQIERKWERANSRRRESERLRSLVQPALTQGEALAHAHTARSAKYLPGICGDHSRNTRAALNYFDGEHHL